MARDPIQKKQNNTKKKSKCKRRLRVNKIFRTALVVAEHTYLMTHVVFQMFVE